MLGEDSDEEEMDTAERKGNTSSQDDEMGCTWGMGKALKLLPEVNIPFYLIECSFTPSSDNQYLINEINFNC